MTGLAENRCLEKRAQGAQLLQIGEQEIAFGAKFRARVVLDIQVQLFLSYCDHKTSSPWTSWSPDWGHTPACRLADHLRDLHIEAALLTGTC